MRMGRLVGLAVAGSFLGVASGCGAAGGHAPARAAAAATSPSRAAWAASSRVAGARRVAGSKVTVVVADRSAAARISVRASSRRGRIVVRRVLAALGRRDPIRSVALTAVGPAGKLPTITVTPIGRGVRAEFEAMVAGDAISRQLPRYQWLQIGASDGTRLGQPTRPTPVAPEALAASVASGIAAAGLVARSIVVFRLPVPAVETVIRMREDQLFDEGAHHWQAAVDAGPAGRPASGLLLVEAPSGAVIAIGGHVAQSGFGGDGSPATTPIPKRAPAALYHQRTRLTITLRRPARAHSPERDVIWTLDCQDDYASTFAHPRAACSRVIRDRWALFAPTSDVLCGGIAGADTIEISGQFAGRTIDYSPGSCDIHTLTRWEQFLHVTPRL